MAKNNDIDKEDAERKRPFDEAMAKMTINEGGIDKPNSSSRRARRAKRALNERTNIRAVDSIQRTSNHIVTKETKGGCSAFFFIFLVLGGFFATIVFIIPHSIGSFGYIKTFLGALVIVTIGSLIFDIFGTTEQKDEMAFGPINPHMNCPHCNTLGNIRTKPISQKKGISGGKAVAGLLTGGVSLLAVGLSRKENSTQAHCKKCGNTWQF